MPQSDNYGFPNPTTITHEGFEDCDELVLIRTTSTEQLKVSRFPRARKEWKKRVLDEQTARPSYDKPVYLFWTVSESGSRPATDENENPYCRPVTPQLVEQALGFGSGYVMHTMWSSVSSFGSGDNVTYQTVWYMDLTKRHALYEDIYDNDGNYIETKITYELRTEYGIEVTIARQENSGNCQYMYETYNFVMKALNEDGTYTPITANSTAYSGNIRFQRLPEGDDETIDSNWQEFGIYSYSFDISPWGVICGDLCPKHCVPVYEKKEDEFACVCLSEDENGEPTFSDDPFDRLYFKH